MKRRRPQQLVDQIFLEETFSRGKHSRPRTNMDVVATVRKKRKRARRNRRKKRGRSGRTRTEGLIGRFPPTGNEWKFIDSNPFNNNSPIFELWNLNTCNIGSAYNQRIGLTTVVKRINLRIRFGPGTGSTASPNNIVRLMILCDKQCNGAQPIATNILQTNEVYQFNNVENKGRFVVLLDKFFAITGQPYWNTPGGVVNYTSVEHFYKKTIKCNIPVNYATTNNGDISDIKTNGLFFVWWAALAGNGYYGRIRVRFEDA